MADSFFLKKFSLLFSVFWASLNLFLTHLLPSPLFAGHFVAEPSLNWLLLMFLSAAPSDNRIKDDDDTGGDAGSAAA